MDQPQSTRIELSEKPLLLVFLANAIGFTFIFLLNVLLKWLPGKGDSLSGGIIFLEFVFTPLLIGGIIGYAFRGKEFRARKQLSISGISLLVTILFSIFLLGEGVFCLIILFPLVYVTTLVGSALIYYLLKKRDAKVRASVGVVVLAFFLLNLTSITKIQEQVTDEVVINATPDKVWKYVADFPTIKGDPSFWMFKLGMPMPVATTVSEHAVGANRKCIFSKGLIFDEVMTVFKPNEELTFDIVGQPNDPEILGHIDLQRGQFLLRANSDGTTTLIGSSWYTLRVFPTWYFNPWAETITRNVHLRVMEHIKQLAELEQKS